MINYLKGDATIPQGKAGGLQIIPHVCNDEGKWGSGFVLALRSVFPEAEKQYRAKDSYTLGEVQFVDCGNQIVVANMIAQRGTKWTKDGSPKGCSPVRYDALLKAMRQVETYARDNWRKTSVEVEIHAPKFGAGLAGGNWDVIEILVKEVWDTCTHVYIYEYEPGDADGKKQQADADSSKADRQADGAKDALGDIFDEA